MSGAWRRAVASAALLVAFGGCGDWKKHRSAEIVELAPAWVQFFAGAPVGLAVSRGLEVTAVAVASDQQGEEGSEPAHAVHVVAGGSGEPLWSYVSKSPVQGISLSGDGGLVAATFLSGRLHLFDREGRQLWRTSAIGWPILSRDGRFIACVREEGRGVDNSVIELYDRWGNRLWHFEDETTVWTLTFDDAGEYLVAALQSRKMYAIDMEGEVIWSRDSGDGVVSLALTAGRAEKVAVATGLQGESLMLLDRKGKTIWRRRIKRGADAVAVSRDGRFVATASSTVKGQRLQLYGEAGERLWGVRVDERASHAPKVALAGSAPITVALLRREGQDSIVGFSRSGEVVWQAKLSASPVGFGVSEDGNRAVVLLESGALQGYRLPDEDSSSVGKVAEASTGSSWEPDEARASRQSEAYVGVHNRADGGLTTSENEGWRSKLAQYPEAGGRRGGG